jgi:hypothetical protein
MSSHNSATTLQVAFFSLPLRGAFVLVLSIIEVASCFSPLSSPAFVSGTAPVGQLASWQL